MQASGNTYDFDDKIIVKEILGVGCDEVGDLGSSLHGPEKAVASLHQYP